MKQNVYILNATGHDYSDAERFGNLITVTKGYIPRMHITQMWRDITQAFEKSDKEDYILMSGPTTLSAVACAVFALKHKGLNLLLFFHGKYEVRKVRFEDGNET